MVAEILEWLEVGPGKVFVDGTLGGGGHAEAMLDASAPDGRVIGIDRDPEALAEASARLARFGERFTSEKANYSEAPEVLARLGLDRVDGMLVDAGVSSHQLDDPARGFSFREEGPLDMRMGDDGPTLGEYLDAVDHEELGAVVARYGEIKGAYRIARAIVEARRAGELETTAQLEGVVKGAAARMGRRSKLNPATLVFQALRIALNDELTHLERAVARVPKVVRPGGLVGFISFHSLEDRIVKRGLKALATDCICPPGLPLCACGAQAKVEILTRKPISPSAREIELNPRARSARLRVARVLETDDA